MRPRRALVSVSDKTGVADLARGLAEAGYEIVSTGGTAAMLEEAGLQIVRVSAITGFPEILDGRVKTLHPNVHGGILARRDDPTHMATLDEHDIGAIDVVCVNLYPFRETVASPDVTLEQGVEQIDIGGPCMIRAAAKNFASVTVLTSPDQYGQVLAEMREGGGAVRESTRRELAVAAFAHTAMYDAAIQKWLGGGRGFPDLHVRAFRKTADLRYGENPHQKAAVYADAEGAGAGLVSAEQLGGSELSYNNLLDLEAAAAACREFERPAAAVIKHGNPCGACEADTIAEAVAGAFRGDPEAAFGGIVGANRPIDIAAAEEMTRKGRFLEAVVATGFDDAALSKLRERSGWGERLRILAVDSLDAARWTERYVEGGLLVQDADRGFAKDEDLRVVSQAKPDAAMMSALRFAMRACKRVKSNAIVLARGTELVGVGAGQMSRIESVRIALRKAGEGATGAVLASDAFFPFRDGVDEAVRAGVAGIIQPGGSKKDGEVIEACNEAGIPLVFTGMRHFLH